MAVTGLLGFGFVIGHLIGNLQFFLGPEVLNAYGAKLRAMPALLMAARSVLVAAVAIHIAAAIQLWSLNRRARPQGYAKWKPQGSTLGARTMIFSGPALFFFIVYHLAHLTWGNAHPDFRHDAAGLPDVYHNVVAGFSNPLVSAVYIVAMVFLGLHLMHGIWSGFQSLGWNHPRYTPLIRNAALAAAALIVLGNISIPIAVLSGAAR